MINHNYQPVKPTKGQEIADRFFGRTILLLTIGCTLLAFLSYLAGALYSVWKGE